MLEIMNQKKFLGLTTAQKARNACMKQYDCNIHTYSLAIITYRLSYTQWGLLLPHQNRHPLVITHSHLWAGQNGIAHPLYDMS